MNVVTLIGRLGQDPEIRYTGSGKAVCNLNVAVDGRDKDNPTWVPVVVWERPAENCAKYLTKGKKVGVVGRLQTTGWETREGQKRTKLEVVAFRVEFLSPPDQQAITENNDGTATAHMPDGDTEDVPF